MNARSADQIKEIEALAEAFLDAARRAEYSCEGETQEFRLQNDREWKFKVDHQKARVIELERELAGALETNRKLMADMLEMERRIKRAMDAFCVGNPERTEPSFF